MKDAGHKAVFGLRCQLQKYVHIHICQHVSVCTCEHTQVYTCLWVLSVNTRCLLKGLMPNSNTLFLTGFSCVCVCVVVVGGCYLNFKQWTCIITKIFKKEFFLKKISWLDSLRLGNNVFSITLVFTSQIVFPCSTPWEASLLETHAHTLRGASGLLIRAHLVQLGKPRPKDQGWVAGL